METCYKMVRAPLMKSLVHTSDRFGFEPELTARLAEGVAVIWHIVRFNMIVPRGRQPAEAGAPLAEAEGGRERAAPERVGE